MRNNNEAKTIERNYIWRAGFKGVCSFWLLSEDSGNEFLGDFFLVTKAAWEECRVRIGNFGKE